MVFKRSLPLFSKRKMSLDDVDVKYVEIIAKIIFEVRKKFKMAAKIFNF